MSAYYVALIWINILLAGFLTPLFLIPGTWLMDRMMGSKRRAARDEPVREPVRPV